MFTVRARLLKEQSALNLEEKNAHGSVIYDQWLVLTSSGHKLEEQQFLIWDRLTTGSTFADYFPVLGFIVTCLSAL